MRTSKKMIAGVSAFIVAVSSVAMSMSVSAVTDDFTVSVSVNEDYDVENQVQVTVDLANVPSTGIAGFEFAVSFDSSALELISVEENPDVVGGASDKELELVPDLKDTMVNDGASYSCFDYYVSDDKIACMWATGLEDSAYWIHTDGTIATFTFEVVEGTDADSVDVGIVPIHDSDDSAIVFASADDSGNYYAYEDVQTGEDVAVDIDAVASTTGSTEVTTTADEDKTTEEPEETDATEEGGEVTTTPDESGETPSTDATDSTTEKGDTTTATPSTGESSGKKGDVNNDGDINSVDLVLVKKYLLTMIDESALDTNNADVNNDSEVNSVDLVFIKKYLLTMIDSLENLG
jgi:hypothetical protein